MRTSYWNTPCLMLTAVAALALWGWYNYQGLPLSRFRKPSNTTGQTKAKAEVEAGASQRKSGTVGEQVSLSTPSRVEFPSVNAERKVGLQTATVRRENVAHSITAPGIVRYDSTRYARLTPLVSGTIWQVYKDMGDTIQQGEVLALIEAADVGQLKANFLLSYAEYELRDATMKRMEAAASSLPEQTLRTADAARRDARIRLFNDRQALLNIGLLVQLNDVANLSDIERIRFMRLLGLPDELRQRVDSQSLTANLLPLTAPFDGLVVQRNAAKGEVVQTSQPQVLFDVADIHQLRIELDVNPEDIVEVRVGQLVEFLSTPGVSEASGVVSHISPQVDPKTRCVTVHAEVSNPGGRLRPNTVGSVRILVGEMPPDAFQTK